MYNLEFYRSMMIRSFSVNEVGWFAKKESLVGGLNRLSRMVVLSVRASVFDAGCEM